MWKTTKFIKDVVAHLKQEKSLFRPVLIQLLLPTIPFILLAKLYVTSFLLDFWT